MNKLTISERKIIYLISVFISLIFFFLAVWQAKPVIVEWTAPLGLVSYLPFTYWIGLVIIMITSIIAVLDRELKNDAIFIVIILVLGLFVSGIAVFVQSNASEPDAYTHFPGVYDLLKTHHLNINLPVLESYNSWPVYHFLSAAMVSVTNVGFALVKYSPLVWLLFLVLVTYGMGKRFGLAPKYCFLIASLAVLSDWISLNDYTPRLLGMILLLCILMMVMKPTKNAGENVTVMILFSALVMTHGTSSIVAIFAITMLAIYRRDPTLVIFFVIILAAWQIYATPLMLTNGILSIRNSVLNIFVVTHMETYQTAASAARLLARYSQLSYLAIYCLLMVGIVIMLIRKKIIEQHRKYVLALFVWIVGTTMMLFIPSGDEVSRTYVFLTVPLACIVCLSFVNWKILLPIICVFCVLFPMARYSGVASFGQVLTTELDGSEFWATRINTQEAYFADNYALPSLVMHYNREMLTYSYWTPNNIVEMGGQSPSEALDSIPYIIMSKQGNDGLMISIKTNPYAAWLLTENGEKSNLLYNNGFFQIYQNNHVN